MKQFFEEHVVQFFKEHTAQFVILVIAFIVLIALTIWGKQDRKKSNDTLKSLLMILVEESYADGQIDALTGDVCVRQVNDSIWVYTKSPWDDSSTTIMDTIIHKP
jgi:hypothetical protein